LLAWHNDSQNRAEGYHCAASIKIDGIAYQFRDQFLASTRKTRPSRTCAVDVERRGTTLNLIRSEGEMSTYDAAFYEYINKGSASSAAAIIPLIRSYFNVRSVIDFGCGQGAWLREWKRSGTQEVLGLDGDYVNRNALLIDKSEVKIADLSNPVDIGKKFDLVQSLEVGEHLPRDAADTFVESLVKHGDVVLFSAAAVGQGGHDHINEQPYEYWRDKFLSHDYILIDWLRQRIKDNPAVDRWYRYNSLCFVKRELADDLPNDLLRYRVANADPVVDISPYAYQVRKRIISKLPPWATFILARSKKHSILLARRFMGGQ
jgi:Methyltransferase domain